MSTGAVTREELLLVWEGAVDPRYASDLKAAGDGNGLEVFGQSSAQLERASNAIDVTAQACYILPWSGQTNSPAAGASKADVTLSFTRTGFIHRPLVLKAGYIFVEEETEDWGENGPQTVRTGRRYIITQDLVFACGITGPLQVPAQSERSGYGYNNPMPGTLRAILQPGANFLNASGTTAIAIAAPASPGQPFRRDILLGINQPDMPVPEHVGQYIVFTAGANSTTPAARGGNARVMRVSEFIPPDPIDDIGSGAVFELLWAVTAHSITGGSFELGEVVGIGISDPPYVAYARLIDITGDKYTFVFLNGTTNFTVGPVNIVDGLTSGARITSFTIDYWNDDITPEAPSGGAGGASWRVLDWFADWGLTVTNVQSPANGKSAMLDQLGSERDIDRAPSEIDDSYRIRIARVADTISPNAIRRALNRALGNIHWCFREVGSAFLPGFFYDGDGTAPKLDPHGAKNDAYDVDSFVFVGAMNAGPTFRENDRLIVRKPSTGEQCAVGFFGKLAFGGSQLVFIRGTGQAPPDPGSGTWRVICEETGANFSIVATVDQPYAAAFKFRRIFDYADMRAFFIVGILRQTGGDTGLFYDNTTLDNAYDLPGQDLMDNFFDGTPIEAAQIYGRVKQNLDLVHAGGVGYKLYQVDDTNECGIPALPADATPAYDLAKLADDDEVVPWVWLSSESLTLDVSWDLAEIPSTLPLDGWWSGYTGPGGAWVGNASGGDSGGRLADAGGSNPTTGTYGVDGAAMAAFDGAAKYTNLAGVTGDYLSETSGSIAIVFGPTDITTTAAATSTSNTPLINDSLGVVGIFLSNANRSPLACFRVKDATGAIVAITASVDNTCWQVVEARWNATTIELRVGDGNWTTGTIAGGGLFTDINTSTVRVGNNFAAVYYLGGISELMLSKQRLADHNFKGIVNYVREQAQFDTGGRKRIAVLRDLFGMGHDFTHDVAMPRVAENVSRYALRGMHFTSDGFGSPTRLTPPAGASFGTGGFSILVSFRLRTMDVGPIVTNNFARSLFTFGGSGVTPVAVLGWEGSVLKLNWYNGSWHQAVGPTIADGELHDIVVTHFGGNHLKVYVDGNPTPVIDVALTYPNPSIIRPIGCGFEGANGMGIDVHELVIVADVVTTGIANFHARTQALFGD